MKTLKTILKYWKLYIALVLIGAALFIYQSKYLKEEAVYQSQAQQMQMLEDALKKSIEKNRRYESIQEELDAAKMELDASRISLYEHFPVELREEDQIMYVLYLETIFGTEINFTFNQPVALLALNDGAALEGLMLQVNYDTTYQGFKDMVSYLATDDRLVSVYDATIEYDQNKDRVSGTIALILYLMDSDKLEYIDPDIAIPELGKDNPFKK